MQSGWGRNYNYYCISPNLKNNRSSVASRGKIVLVLLAYLMIFIISLLKPK